MSRLMTLLKKDVGEGKREEQVIFSSRLKNDDGSPVTATVTPISSRQLADYRKQVTKAGKKGKIDFDQYRYYNLIVLNHTVDPNFKDEKEIKELGCQTPEQLLDKLLNAGEVENLVQAILEISGLDESIEELKDQAKN